MHSTDKKLPWGRAKTEVISRWPEIKNRLSRGEPVSSIYRDMVARGLVGCTAKSFFNLVSRFRRERFLIKDNDAGIRSPLSTPVSSLDSVRQTTLTPPLVSDGPVVARAGPPDLRYFEDDEDQPSREEGKALLRGERRRGRQSP